MFSCAQKVCIVGGGPAGLAAAIALRRENYDVTVVDCAIPPMNKACGEGLMPDTIRSLSDLGVEIPGAVGFPFRGIRFADARSSVLAEFPNGMARGVRRTILHELLVQHAMRSGVSLLWGAKHIHLAKGGVSANGGLIEAGLVVGADGQNSGIRRQASLDQVKHEKRRYGFRRHYRTAPWSHYIELHWGMHSQLYVTPVASDEICVAVISRDPAFRLEHALREFPEVGRRLESAPAISPEMGALSMSRTLRRVQRRNLILIGDASGSVDAITGEGMGLAFKQALAVAQAVRARDIRSYQTLHKALMKRARRMAALMLLLESDDRLQRRALAGLASQPEFFKSFLAIHADIAQFRDLWPSHVLKFGRAFLAA